MLKKPEKYFDKDLPVPNVCKNELHTTENWEGTSQEPTVV